MKNKNNAHHVPVWMLYYKRLLENERKGKDEPMSRTARDIDVTYSHINKIVKIGEEAKELKVNKRGRISYVYLTEKGREQAEASIVILGDQ